MLVLLATAGLAAKEVHTPREIPWVEAELHGFAAQRADDLVLQEERGRDVWATQGYSLYRSRDGGPFVKLYTVRTRFGEAWGGYLRSLRRAFGYQELVELLPISDGLVIAFAGGMVYRVDLVHGTQEAVHTLRYFGRGQGRGVMGSGLAIDGQGRLFYGEYPTFAGRNDYSVALWRSLDEGRTWEIAYEFPLGSVRHIHNVQWDPVGGALWMGTGDQDSRSQLGYSTDGGRTFTWIGKGSQRFRVVSLLFLADCVAWGMDADTQAARTLRWWRSSGIVEENARVLPGPVYFTEALDATGGILGLAEMDAAVWRLGCSGEPEKALQWTLPNPKPPGPHPAIRLARGQPEPRRYVLVNPLRTVEDEASIYRIPLAAWRTRFPDLPPPGE